ncbi:hypothetical protein B7L51_019535 [Pectobacterium brasiliense]|uniref:hypothetical protein n=1 Tax=Pectobacterium brasiliense TaxID=180957 RepID=UPI000B9713E3|nr:hypothetical protein [Pectobacterium carotovorum]OYN49470.1 hypothetical protein B7L51_19580 [Pectobacterium carotovorum]
MTKIIRYAFFVSLIFASTPSISASCQQSDENEKFACESYASIKKNVANLMNDANRVMVGNSSLRSLNTLYDLQVKNCKNFKCRTDVSSKYYMVVRNAIDLKPSHVEKKLTLEQACEAITYMRYYSAVAAFSPSDEAYRAEVNAKRFGRDIMVDDITPYVKSFLSPSSVSFRQAYIQGDAALAAMFTQAMGSCQSVPTAFIPTLPNLVRSDGIDFDELIKVYQR